MLFTLLIVLTITVMCAMFFQPQKKWLFAVTLCLYAVSFGAFAQDGTPIEPPAWLESVLVFIQSVPKVGPVVVEIFKWIGVVASVFTALSVAVSVILKVPEIAARWAGAGALAEKIEKLNEKVQPWLKYLSIFNVKK
jgi:predicted protein tyrosine phosphatase